MTQIVKAYFATGKHLKARLKLKYFFKTKSNDNN